MIGHEHRQRLLDLARRALVARVRRHPAPEPPDALNVPASGVFVTIYHRRELRGCLGTLDAAEPLAHAIVRLGGDVTHRDYRFDPLEIHEVEEVTIDLSILTEPERVGDPTEIEVGRHGLIIEHVGRKGLLLPQVAPEHGFDREAFLAQTCLKAGLPPNAWQQGATIYRFEAEVFGETDFV